MTSAVRTTKKPAGFTLLEIVIVISISAVILGGAVGLMVFSSGGRDLKDASGEVELLAKRARTAAILFQTPYAVELRSGVIRLMPLAEAGRQESKRRTAGGHKIGGETEAPASDGDRYEYIFPENVSVFIRRWNSNDWLPSGGDSIHIWRFDPNGLCEPLSMRYVRDNNWLEDTFNPLTGAIRETEYEIR